MSNMLFSKRGLAYASILSVVVFLASCGGGGGGGSGGSEGPVEVAGPQATDISIAGQALVGSALSGVVSVYKLDDDGQRGDLYSEAVNTTENKDYAISISGLEGDTVLVELVSDLSTPVICGLPVCERNAQGSPVVEFGGSHAPSISLTGIVVLRPSSTPSVTNSVTRSEHSGLNLTVNLNPLTTIAANLALSKVNSNSSVVLSDLAIAANAQLANRFGISELNLLDAQIIDLTQSDAVNNASKKAIENSLKIAGVLGAAVTQGRGDTLGDALAGFSSDFVNQGIADRELENSGAVTIEETLEEALALLNKVKTVTGVTVQEQSLQAAQNDISNEKTDKQQNGSTTSTQGDVPDDIGEDGLVASKAMVKQLRDLAAATDVFAPSANQTAFSDEIEAASLLVGGDLDTTGLAIELVFSVIGDAFEANQESPQASYSSQGVNVTITNSGNNETYVVDQNVTVAEKKVAVYVTGTKSGSLEMNDSEDNDTRTWTGNGDGALDIEGKVGTDSVGVEMKPGSKIQYKFKYNDKSRNTSEGSNYADEWDTQVTLDSASVKLVVSIAQKTANPVGFEGIWTATLNGFSATDKSTYDYDGSSFSSTEEGRGTFQFGDASMSLSGAVTAPSGSSFDASLSFTVGDYSETCEYGHSYNGASGSFQSYDECVDSDTNSDFAAISVNMIFHLNVEGLSDDVRVALEGGRNGLEDGEVELEFSYDGGKMLTAVYNSSTANRTVTLTNHNNVQMSAVFLDTFSGDIKLADKKYADLDEDAGVLMVTYSDGTFESIAM
jgi:hypothetical protein